MFSDILRNAAFDILFFIIMASVLIIAYSFVGFTLFGVSDKNF